MHVAHRARLPTNYRYDFVINSVYAKKYCWLSVSSFNSAVNRCVLYARGVCTIAHPTHRWIFNYRWNGEKNWVDDMLCFGLTSWSIKSIFISHGIGSIRCHSMEIPHKQIESIECAKNVINSTALNKSTFFTRLQLIRAFHCASDWIMLGIYLF